MKKIERGCTEAKTRVGGLVTKLTWFETKDGYQCAGILNEGLHAWAENGRYHGYNASISNLDIFSMPKSKREAEK